MAIVHLNCRAEKHENVIKINANQIVLFWLKTFHTLTLTAVIMRYVINQMKITNKT